MYNSGPKLKNKYDYDVSKDFARISFANFAFAFDALAIIQTVF